MTLIAENCEAPVKTNKLKAHVCQTLAPALTDATPNDSAKIPTAPLSVTLTGACGTCPASDQTLKAGIERIMRDRIDGVTEVVAI